MIYPEKYRNAGTPGGPGRFHIPMRVRQAKYWLVVIISDDFGWEHASVTVKKFNLKEMERTPTWSEMCFVKDLVWTKQQCVLQFHPPESEYVNNHEYCLHLWRSEDGNFETPPKFLV